MVKLADMLLRPEFSKSTFVRSCIVFTGGESIKCIVWEEKTMVVSAVARSGIGDPAAATASSTLPKSTIFCGPRQRGSELFRCKRVNLVSKSRSFQIDSELAYELFKIVHR